MDAKELRIGNFINVGGCTIDTYQTYTPCVVNIGMLKQIQEENKERPDAILSVWQPIPLTEEWLLKFGFEKNGFGEKTKSINPFDKGIKELVFESDYLFLRDCDEDVLKIDNHSLTTLWNKDLKKNFYVHQLQNLYFALTSQELEITKA